MTLTSAATGRCTGRERRRYVWLALVVCFGQVFAASVHAQETVNSASLSGRVTDVIEEGLAGAHVSVRQTDTNVVSESITDEQGRFRFPYLQVGPYEMTVRVEGFANARRTVRLSVGSAFDVSIMLTVSYYDGVVVERPLLETLRPRSQRR